MQLGITTWAEVISFIANVASPIGVLGAVVAIFYAAKQLSLARKASSAAAIVPIDESFRQRWADYFKAQGDRKSYCAAEIFNLIELTCSIFEDKLFTGKSGALLEAQIVRMLQLIQKHEQLRTELLRSLETPDTFVHIADFLRDHPEARPALPAH